MLTLVKMDPKQTEILYHAIDVDTKLLCKYRRSLFISHLNLAEANDSDSPANFQGDQYCYVDNPRGRYTLPVNELDEVYIILDQIEPHQLSITELMNDQANQSKQN